MKTNTYIFEHFKMIYECQKCWLVNKITAGFCL